MKEKLIRIAPILLIIVIAFLAIGALVSLGRMFMNGDNGAVNKDRVEEVDSSVEKLLSLDVERSVRMTVRGPIVAEEDFRSYVVEVSPDNRKLITYSGYVQNVIDLVDLDNNSNSYDQFVHSLNKANMMKGSQPSGEADDMRGICATGRTYEFAILMSGEAEKRLWTSTCTGSKGSLEANVTQLQNLFISQIPNNSEIVRDLGVGKN